MSLTLLSSGLALPIGRTPIARQTVLVILLHVNVQSRRTVNFEMKYRRLEAVIIIIRDRPPSPMRPKYGPRACDDPLSNRLAVPLRSVGWCKTCNEPVEWVVAISASTTRMLETYDFWRTVCDAARTCAETSQRSGKGLRSGDRGRYQGDQRPVFAARYFTHNT